MGYKKFLGSGSSEWVMRNSREKLSTFSTNFPVKDSWEFPWIPRKDSWEFQRIFRKIVTWVQTMSNLRPHSCSFVDKLEKNYWSNPYLYDLDLTPPSIGVKLIRQGTLSTPMGTPWWPCSLCSIKGFQANHFSLSMNCGVGELSVCTDILELNSDNHLCPSCTQAHDPTFNCKLTFRNGVFKVCPKGCLYDGLPVQQPCPLCHGVPDQHKQVNPSCGKCSHGRAHYGHSIWHWLPTQSNLLFNPFIPTPFHVLPWALLQGESTELRKERKGHPYHWVQAEVSWEKPETLNHKRRPQQRFWILTINSSQVEVIHGDLDLATHRSGLHLTGKWQPPVQPYRNWTRLAGNGSVPEQPDPEIHGVWLCPLQHHHLGEAPHPLLQSNQEIQEGCQENQEDNQGIRKRNRRRIRYLWKKTGGEPGNPG